MGGSEVDAQDRAVGRRGWYVLENRAYAGIEPTVVPRFGVKGLEVVVHPLPYVVPGERKARRPGAAQETLRKRDVQRYLAHLEEIGRIDPIIRPRRRHRATRPVDRLRFVYPSGFLQGVELVAP